MLIHSLYRNQVYDHIFINDCIHILLIESTTSTWPSYDSGIISSSNEHCPSGTAAWILVAILAIAFIGSFTLNVTMVTVWVYKKRHAREKNAQALEYKIEGNPCYETSLAGMKQTADTETHVYEMVREKRQGIS